MENATTSSARFIDNGDKTVTDTKTGLTWQKTDDGKARTWKDAKKYCEEISLPGKGWRMPTREELESILDLTRYNPAIDPIFEGAKSDWYWSSTAHADYTDYAWFVLFYHGYVSCSSRDSLCFVRAVRQNS